MFDLLESESFWYYIVNDLFINLEIEINYLRMYYIDLGLQIYLLVLIIKNGDDATVHISADPHHTVEGLALSIAHR